jgi:RNA polymerase sigma-70 factor (ECF subfamily)
MSLHTISVIYLHHCVCGGATPARRAILRRPLAANGMSSFSTSRLTSLLLTDTGEVSTISRSPADVSDEELLARISGGHREVLTQLFRRHAPAVFAIGRRILRDAAEAEDLVQDVFLYVFKKSAAYDSSKGPARSWFFQVAYTQALLRRRKLSSQGFYDSSVAEESGQCRDSGDSGAAYESTVEGLFGRSVWKKIVESLTEDQRETLRLHFF